MLTLICRCTNCGQTFRVRLVEADMVSLACPTCYPDVLISDSSVVFVSVAGDALATPQAKPKEG